jgi:G3E family GTPase
MSEIETKLEGRMRLTILGGFLGSGKTTWLRHQLHEGRFANAYVIVNEAAEMPVDDALLNKARRLTVLAGGCACCQGKEELLAALRKLCNERSATTANRPDEIVLETSGLADPAPIAAAIMADFMLAFHIVHAKTIVASDALHGLLQLQSDALARRQIEVADELVITKLDEAGEQGTKLLLATLRAINPGAAMTGAIRGTPVELPLVEGIAPAELPSVGPQPRIFPTVLRVRELADWTTLTVWLSALLHARGDEVVRVKGVMRTPAGRLLLQSVRKVMQKPEILPEQIEREDDTLVVIGSGYGAEDLARSLEVFARAGKG